jgi:DNA-binding NarL/FixJ family response regulator
VIRVMLVDDHALFRSGLRTLLSMTTDLEVVGEAGDGGECLRIVGSVRPDVILLDLQMPRVDGVETLRRLAGSPTRARVIALTTFDDDDIVFEALREGALGYLLKDASVDDIVAAVRAAAEGASVLAPRVAHKLVNEFARLSRLGPARTPEPWSLSPRELEILRCLARGRSNKEIANELGIAEGTVKNHLTSIFGKLGVDDRMQAALLARQHGIA